VSASAAAPPFPSPSLSAAAASPGTTIDEQDDDVVDPDDLVLPPGVPSTIDRDSPLRDEDAAFRCPGCVRPECSTPRGCSPTAWRLRPDGYLREALTARVYDVAVLSPLEPAQRLGESLGGATVLLKREDLQPVFSFKLRGAYNKMARLSPEQLARGVITSSAGNHAQGVALAAKRLGTRAVICMPVATPEIKVANVRRLGGEVALVGESYQEAQAAALARSAQEGLTFVAPYDDPYTIAGQATIGDEILRQTDADGLDAIFVAIGGGGLAAGIAAYVKALKPNIRVFGVEPTGANAMAQSLLRGRRLSLSRVDAFADGVAVKQVGVETFRLCRDLLDGVILVDNAAISAAIKDVFNDTRSIVEPAGAVAVAGAKAWLQREYPQGVRRRSGGGGENGGGSNRSDGSDGAAATKTTTTTKPPVVVAVTSGANINFERLRLVSELADLGSRTEAMFATTIPERPGSFRAFVAAATGLAIPDSSSSSSSEAEEGAGGNGGGNGAAAPDAPLLEEDAQAAPSAARLEAERQQQRVAQAAAQAMQRTGLSVTEFKYRANPGSKTANVLWSATVPLPSAAASAASSAASSAGGKSTAAEIAERLCAAGLPTRDIGGMGLAQVHLRHLVGGRAAGGGGGGAGEEGAGAAAGAGAGGGGLPDERIFEATFPERPGALALFLGALSPEWNITLFHYRDTGNRESSVLLGLQLPVESGAPRAFRRAVRSLGSDFAVEEVVGDEAEVFRMFIQ
jgi:threonine dehydratase